MTVPRERPVVVVDADVLGQRRTGDETHMNGLLRGLVAHLTDLDVMAATRRPDLVPEGIGRIDTGRGGQALRLLRTLPSGLRRAGADLLHGNYFLPARWHGRSVVTVHDISFARHSNFMPRHDLMAFRALVPRAMRRAGRVLTVSQWAKLDIVDHYGIDPDRVVVTPNAVDDDVTPLGPVPDRPPYLLFVGGLQPRKDPLTAVRALEQVDPDLELLIVGPDRGQRADVMRAAEQAGVSARLHLLDYVGRAELLGLYRGAQALVFPSLYEGFGLPILEAMASGTPVVAAATTAIPEVVGDAGVLVTPSDPEALADGIRQAQRDAPRLVAAGLARAEEHRWTTTAARTAEVYREVLAE